MLHKRFVFVSLLAPSLSFASTATDSLAGSTRDVFDNLTENPAFVNAEGGKSYLRISKAGSVQAITTAGGYGLGIQVNTLGSGIVNANQASTKALENAAAAMRSGLPLSLTMGGAAGETKWGAGLKYQNSKITGQGGLFDPAFMRVGVSAGVIMGNIEAALGWNRDSWKLATSVKSKTPAAEVQTYLDTGMSEQNTDVMDLSARYTMGQYQWFLAGSQSATKAKMWDKNTQTGSDRNDWNKSMTVDVGAERSDKLTDGIQLFSKGGLGWSSTTKNNDDATVKTVTTNLGLTTAHGVEVSAASWVTLRAGVEASVYGNEKITTTTYSAANNSGTSFENATTTAHVMRYESVPTMGVGFKFGNYTIDASLAQDGTGDLGFSDKVLGKVEVTGQF